MLKIEISEEVATVEQMAELLEYIAGLVRDGMTSGHYPNWTLNGAEEKASGDVV